MFHYSFTSERTRAGLIKNSISTTEFQFAFHNFIIIFSTQLQFPFFYTEIYYKVSESSWILYLQNVVVTTFTESFFYLTYAFKQDLYSAVWENGKMSLPNGSFLKKYVDVVGRE